VRYILLCFDLVSLCFSLFLFVPFSVLNVHFGSSQVDGPGGSFTALANDKVVALCFMLVLSCAVFVNLL